MLLYAENNCVLYAFGVLRPRVKYPIIQVSYNSAMLLISVYHCTCTAESARQSCYPLYSAYLHTGYQSFKEQGVSPLCIFQTNTAFRFLYIPAIGEIFHK